MNRLGLNIVLILKLGKMTFCQQIYCYRPPILPLYLYAGFGRPLDSCQDRVTVKTEATANCTSEVSPLHEINNFHCLQIVYLFRSEILITSFASTE
jgi:hypothetical protein